jgi:hypothetical protein
MAIAFSFLAKTEGLHSVPRLQAQLNEALAENEKLTKDNDDLTKKLTDATNKLYRLERFLDRIQIDVATLRPRGDTIPIDVSHTYVLSKTGGGAPGHPLCALKSHYLFNFYLLSDMWIRGEQIWGEDDALAVSHRPGIGPLSSGAPLSLDEFRTSAEALSSETLATNECVFAVRVIRQTKDADAFDAELQMVQRFFAVGRH